MKTTLNKISKVGITIILGGILLIGCTKATPTEVINTQVEGLPTQEEVQGIAVGEPNPSMPDASENPDLAAGTSLKLSEEGARAMQVEKSIDGIVSISLTDIEGNKVDRTFSKDETSLIQQAFNDSFIMDTAYIEMITGNIMTITLEDGRDVFITSYGDENYIVARIGDGPTYHLGCDVIGKILLEKN